MSKRATAVLCACFCTIFAAYSIRYSYGTLLPEMLPYLSITKAEAGGIYSSYFAAYTILSPILGLAADRYSIRFLVSIFVAIMGAGTFLMQYPTSLLQASLFFTVAGIGCSACWAPVMALAQRWTSDKRRGLSLSLVDAGSSLGVMAAGGLVPLAVAGAGWQLGWMGLGIMGLALGVINFILIRDRPGPSSPAKIVARPRARVSGTTYKQLLQDRRFWLLGLAYLLTGFAIIIPFTFISTYAVQELAFPYESATLLITIIGGGGMIGKLTLGPLSDRVGRIKIMALCAALITAGCLAMAYGRGPVLMAVCFIFGIGYGACWALYAACAADFFSRQSAGKIIGLWTFLLGIGSVIAPIISGWSKDVSGTFMWAFIIAAAGGLVSLLFLLPVMRSLRLAAKRPSL
jgi:MFS family permease